MNAALLNSLWQGALITAIAAGVTCVVPKRSAATRYAVWFAALLVFAIVPIASQWHPSAPFTPLPLAITRTTSAATQATEHAAIASGAWLTLVWFVGFAFCLLRLGLSYLRIARIVGNATPAPELGPEVVISQELAIPIAARMLSPVIVIPSVFASSLERDDLESIVLHERAHIRRRDVAGNFLQRIIEACFFFNPWVYVIGRQLVAEREAACDAWAVFETHNPDRYASCLARIAQGSQSVRAPLLTPSAIGSRHILVDRIARLLNGKVGQLKINYLVLGASVAAFAILAVCLQTSTELVSAAQVNQTLVATNASCKAPGSSGASALNAAAPQIPNADNKPGLTATVLVDIAANGHPTSARVVKSSGNGAVDKAVTDAAMHSTYSPAMKACKAVAGQYYFRVQTGP